jgi:hypothetical protein
MGRAEDLFNRLVAGGAAAVEEFIKQAITEELFLDYKRSADDGAGTALNNKDRSNLAKAISGFGNSEGGIILWGVECRNDPAVGDVPVKAVHINQPTRFKSWLEQATSGLTVPPHNGVRHHAIAEGFVVTLISSGMHAPYQALPELSYYIRAGSSFAKAPHAVLSGMFGRRPQPVIRPRFPEPEMPTLLGRGTIQTRLRINLYNRGRGLAEHCFLNLRVKERPGSRCLVEIGGHDATAWWVRTAAGPEIQVVMREGYPLPPEAHLQPAYLTINLTDPIEAGFWFEGTCGCVGAETWRFEWHLTIGEINNAFSRLAKMEPDALEAESALRKFSKDFYKSLPRESAALP